MFTGLIEEIGAVRGVEDCGSGINLVISSDLVIEGTKIGDSISIDGACQTVTKINSDSFTAFASKVTREATTLGAFKVGRKVNLERAMSANARFGGHFVQGHVDGTGKIKSLEKDENGLRIDIAVSSEILKYLVDKGSVTVDGISLTVVSVEQNVFIIYIIPETIKNTTLARKSEGDVVNIEVDILSKYVEKMMGFSNEVKSEKDKNLKRTLMEEGFM